MYLEKIKSVKSWDRHSCKSKLRLLRAFGIEAEYFLKNIGHLVLLQVAVKLPHVHVVELGAMILKHQLNEALKSQKTQTFWVFFVAFRYLQAHFVCHKLTQLRSD